MRYLATMHRCALASAWTAAAIGALTLLGRVAELPLLAALGGGEPIRISVALALILGSGGVVGLMSGQRNIARGAAVMLLAIAFAIIGRLRLADAWLWPSPTTGITLLLLGASLLVFGERRRAGEALAMAAGALALFAMMRVLLGVSGDDRLSALTWVSFPAALGQFLLALALLFSNPRSKTVRLLASTRLDGEMARWMLPAAILIPCVLAALYLLAYHRGWVGIDLGLALMMTVLICLSVGVAFANATRLRALALTEERERALLDNAQELAGIGSWVLDRRLASITYSRSCAVLFGTEPERMLPGLGGLLTLICDRDRIGLAAALDALSADNPLLETDVVMCRADGSERHLRMRVQVELDEDDSARRLFGSFFDYTEQWRSERALREHEQYLETLLRSLGDAVIATDTSGRVRHMNPVAEGLIGWSLDEALGRPLVEVFNIINEGTRMPVENPVARVLREGRVVGLANHTALVHRDGEERSIADSAAPVRDQQGNIIGVVMVFHDVTDLRLMEEEQEHLRARLISADRMASLGLLAAGVAHEINNPLSYLIGGLSMLEPSLFDRLRDAAKGSTVEHAVRTLIVEGRELAHDCQQGAERVRRIVSDLSVFGRNQDDSADAVGANVREAVELAVRMAGSQLRSRARIETELGTVAPVAIGQARLGQVLLNLLINAAHAIPEGSPDEHFVRLSVQHEPDGQWVSIQVEDTGCGIAPEHLSRLFEPFFTTKPVGQGTGLGLSICHGIVTAAGGEITVDSEPGRGTTFRLRLPVAQRTVTAARGSLPALLSARRGRVLIIDDDPLVAKIVARMLQSSHDSEVVTQPEVALNRLLRGEQFDAVLCDLMMPTLTGMDLYARIAAARPAILDRFVFMTGGAVSSKAQDFVRQVTRPCLDKPVDRLELHGILQKVVSTVPSQGMMQ